MNTQQLRAEIAKAKIKNEFKISSLSDKHYNTFLVAFEFIDSELQAMFHVKPLDEDGNGIDVDFFFYNEVRAIEFMNSNRGYHSLAWWDSIWSARYSILTCQSFLYKFRKVMEGGQK